MRKIGYRIFTLMLICIAASSCQGSKVDPEFVGTNTTGLTVKGQKVFVFDSMNCAQFLILSMSSFVFSAITYSFCDIFVSTLRA